MIVTLRPLTKDAWAGIIKYKNCHEDLAPYFTRSGRIYTGLTPEDEIRLGEQLGLDLKTGSDYWKMFHVRTSGKDIYLHLDEPFDELKYLFLKNHKRVANGLADRKATANFVLINQEVEAEETNKLNRAKRRALKELDKMTYNDIKQCLRLFGHNADNMNAEVAEAKLTEIVEGNPDKFIEKWINNQTKDTEYLIKQAVSKNILRKNKTVYKFGTDIIGYTLEDSIIYLDNPLNQDVKIAIMRDIEVK